MKIDINGILYGSIRVRILFVAIVVVVLFITTIYSSLSRVGTVMVLKKESKELKQEIKENQKIINNLSVDLANKTTALNQAKAEFLEAELRYNILKSNNRIINIKYEKLYKNYHGLSDDDKWKYFRAVVSE